MPVVSPPWMLQLMNTGMRIPLLGVSIAAALAGSVSSSSR